MSTRVLVTGAGGFIGHHLVSHLVEEGHEVRGVDLKEPEFEPTRADEFLTLDLCERAACDRAVADVEEVYTLPVTREGYIVIPDAGQVSVNGLTMAQLEDVLFQRLGEVYSGVTRGRTSPPSPTSRWATSAPTRSS